MDENERAELMSIIQDAAEALIEDVYSVEDITNMIELI